MAMGTSLCDGMNLVSYEFVACRSDNAGVLILSEFAGECAVMCVFVCMCVCVCVCACG